MKTKNGKRKKKEFQSDGMGLPMNGRLSDGRKMETRLCCFFDIDTRSVCDESMIVVDKQVTRVQVTNRAGAFSSSFLSFFLSPIFPIVFVLLYFFRVLFSFSLSGERNQPTSRLSDQPHQVCSHAKIPREGERERKSRPVAAQLDDLTVMRWKCRTQSSA